MPLEQALGANSNWEAAMGLFPVAIQLAFGCLYEPQAWLCLVHTTVFSAHNPRKEFHIHGVLNEIYLQNIFRNEYNFSRQI